MNNPIPVSEYHKGCDHARKATIAKVRRRAKDRRDETQLYDIHGEQIFSLEDLNNILDEMEAEG